MSAQEQVNFLLACIKHSQAGGKVDFEAVATELKIKTKAAAAKRYERLKKRALCSDLATTSAGGDCDENGSPFATPQKSRTKATASGPVTPGSAKRKRNDPNSHTDSDGDEQGGAAEAETPGGKAKPAKARTPRTKRQQAQKAAEAIKQEAEAETEAAEDVAEHEDQPARENTEADEEDIRDDVIEVKLEARNIVADADGF